MTKEEFYEIFEDFHFSYKYKKDGGWDEFYAIVSYIKRLDNEEQGDFIKYCIEEVKQEYNAEWYLSIVSKVQNKIAIDLLYDIFIQSKELNTTYIKNILGTLFELRDCNKDHLLEYENYIDTFTYDDFDINDYFFILKYLFINPKKSINILSKHFNTMYTETSLVNAIKESMVTFLAYCEFSSFEYFYQLMMVIRKENVLLETKLINTLKELYYSDRLYYDEKKKSEIKKYLDLFG